MANFMMLTTNKNKMQIQTNEVYIFKLNSGEEVIGKVVPNVDSTTSTPPGYLLRKPFNLVLHQVRPGELGLMMVPWLHGVGQDSDTPVEIYLHSIASVAKPGDEVAAKYMEQSSMIQIATASSLLQG
jgi:hypothetical protein